MPDDSDFWATTLRVFVIFAAVLGLMAAALLAYVYRRLHAIGVPDGADLFTTLRHVPIALPIALDLLDLMFDIFATPIVWVVLSRFRMQALRNAAAAEALIPFTQPLPIFTALWIAARLFKLGTPPPHYDLAPGRLDSP